MLVDVLVQTQNQVDMACTEWPKLGLVKCHLCSVSFVRSNSGGAAVVLRRPHHTQTITRDGNYPAHAARVG